MPLISGQFLNGRITMEQQAISTRRAALRSGVPAWAMSLALHTMLFVGLGFALRFAPQGPGVEPSRTVGIALVKQQSNQREYIYTDKPVSESDSTSQTNPNIASVLPSAAAAAIDLEGILPSADQPLFGAGELNVPDATDLSGGNDNPLEGLSSDITTSVFGVTGTGSKFVYVFDRSGSMLGRPLAAAKQQLEQSLADLEEIHQFQIIFYNNLPKFFKLAGRDPKLVWGNNEGKTGAIRFVRGIQASGGTRHMSAMKMALGMRPDVIFFLTDADEPQLTIAELDRIRRLNGGTMINAIEFGSGPQGKSENFLTELARQNGGQHVYVDTSLFRTR